MKSIPCILFFLFMPGFCTGQTFISSVTRYVELDTTENIDRIIDVYNESITIISKGKLATDIQEWFIMETEETVDDYGSGKWFLCTSPDRQVKATFFIYNEDGQNPKQITAQIPPDWPGANITTEMFIDKLEWNNKTVREHKF
ncbi:hypothetical protein OQ279_14760 [Salinimicrobium sp. MT39]|uniref:Uncharacterized protein n=1 Tax=Salinimicrobium profundisediminis TaxID=2994553 RepID=A0A9X3CZJ3_9FLAO|nr:hypothetical protein [Salinimicrobium profundisediminis]MCX2839412.1 hypothetical protein [Salinimicrobium profundisediminis]